MADSFTIPDVPPWTLSWLRVAKSLSHQDGWADLGEGWSRRQLESPGYSLISYRLNGAKQLSAEAFERACYRAYRQLEKDLSGQQASEPIRLWNFLPGILDPLGDLDHRYMVFNAGRYRAMIEWFGEQRLDARVATASGVGHEGEDFVLHCLAAEHLGQPVENPRQRPAYRYSERFGPLPPCFARATQWRKDGSSSPWLLVGGTASVRGEDSFHEDDLRRQLDETFYNLAALVRSAHGIDCAHLSPDEVRAQLRQYEDLRVYFVRSEQKARIADRLEELISPRAHIEYFHVDLCRPELLVEIEGLVCLAQNST